MEKFENTLDLLKASWNVLKKDKEILFFPVLSGVSVLVLLASFVVPTFLVGDPASVRRIVNEDRDTLMMMGFVFYFLNYLIIIFFNSAIVACATIRMKGEDPTVFDGLNIAAARIHHIIMWALVSATLGMIFRMIQEKSNFLGKVIGGLLGIAWSLTSYFVVPVMVNENKGPFDSFMDSVELIKKTWGENILGNMSFGLIFTIASLPACLAVIAGVAWGKGALVLPLGIFAVGYLLILAIVQSALQGIFQAALYQFARFGNAPPGFREEQLRHAIKRKY